MPIDLTPREHELKDGLARAVEDLMLRADAESVGRIAEHVTEHGTGGDGGAIVDTVIADCLRIVVDNLGLV
jgi:hypothetical protein